MNHHEQFYHRRRLGRAGPPGDARRDRPVDRAAVHPDFGRRRRPTSTAPSPPPARPSTAFDDARDERLALLRRILDAYNARADDLAEAVSREMGAPLAFARDAQVWAGRVHLEATIEALETLRIQPRQGIEPHRQGADRRRRADHAVELAAQPDRLQGRAGARRRLHDGAEAERDRAAQRRSSSPRSSTRPARRRACSTSSTGRARRRPGDGGASGRRHGLVHRLDPRRHPRRQGGGRHGQARRAGARRQVAQHPPAATPISPRR